MIFPCVVQSAALTPHSRNMETESKGTKKTIRSHRKTLILLLDRCLRISEDAACCLPGGRHVPVDDPPCQPARLHHHGNMGRVSLFPSWYLYLFPLNTVQLSVEFSKSLACYIDSQLSLQLHLQKMQSPVDLRCLYKVHKCKTVSFFGKSPCLFYSAVTQESSLKFLRWFGLWCAYVCHL